MTLSGRPSIPPSSTALSDLYDVLVTSKERSSQNMMKRGRAVRRIAISSGRLSMSSRWISTSLRPLSLAALTLALISACTALTSDDLPMPRAPHKSALLAGRPRAKRSVFSTSMSRTRSMPLSSDISTRLTRAIGVRRRPSGCQTKASAAAKSGVAGARGARRSSAAAMRLSVSARNETSGAARSDMGGFQASVAIPKFATGYGTHPYANFGIGALACQFPIAACAASQGEGGKLRRTASVTIVATAGRAVAIAGAAAIVRADFGRRPDRFVTPGEPTRGPDADLARVRPVRWWGAERHVDVVAAVHPDFRYHVFPDPAATAAAGEAASGHGQECAARRHCGHLGRPRRQGHQSGRRGQDRDRAGGRRAGHADAANGVRRAGQGRAGQG